MLTVVGKRIGEFIPKGGSEKIRFAQLHCVNSEVSKDFEGSSVEIIGTNWDLAKPVSVGDNIEVSYNKYQKPSKIDIL